MVIGRNFSRRFAGSRRTPFPVPYLWQVLAMLVNIMLMLNKLVLHLLFEVVGEIAVRFGG